jgi:vesicle coat complex subunit
LFDREHEVRKTVLKGLAQIFEKYEDDNSLMLFYQRFSVRINEMIADVDSSVAAAAVHLLGVLDGSEAYVVDEEQLDRVSSLMWDEAYVVRRAAALQIYQSLTFEETEDASRRKEQLVTVASMFLESKPDILSLKAAAEVFCSTVFDIIPIVRDWEAYLSLLSDTDVADSLHSCIAALYAGSCKVLSKKMERPKSKKHQVESEVEEMSIIAINSALDVLPCIQADSAAVCEFVTVFEYIDLNQFVVGQKQQELQDLVALLRKIFLMHSENDTIQNISSCFASLSQISFAWHDIAKTSCMQLVSELIKSLVDMAKQLPVSPFQSCLLISSGEYRSS